MSWPWEVAERDHALQNPTSPEKIALLGEYLRLGPESRVLDLACGTGGPALLLAERFGCRVVGVELRDAFVERARARIAAAGLQALVEVRQGDAAGVALEPESWDAVLCLGASFVWGTMTEAAAALAPAVRPAGGLAIGEPFWRAWPLPAGVGDGGYVPLHETAARLERAGVALTGLIASSEDDWDRYESLHWRALEEWLDGEAVADRAGLRAEHEHRRSSYLGSERALLGWAIFVGRRER
jgi:SAM-dependent methyltransferase